MTSRRANKAAIDRTGSGSSMNELIDGESMASTTRTARSSISLFKFNQSPGMGGFGATTPLFMNADVANHSISSHIDSVSSSMVSDLLPNSSDMLKLILSVASHRTGPHGLLKSWMGSLEMESVPGRIRLLVGLGYIMMNGQGIGVSNNTSCPLTWQDITYLRRAKELFEEEGTNASEMAFLISTVLEEVLRKDLSLKFRLENVLDFNDQITTRGWLDGGRDSVGSHSEELRIWLRNECANLGIALHNSSTNDQSPRNTGARSSRIPIVPHGMSKRAFNDPFTHESVDRVFGQWDVADSESDSEDPSTPIKRSPISSSDSTEPVIREIIVVDIQTDHALRRHINKALELRREFHSERQYVIELRKFVHKRLHYETAETKGSIFKLAQSKEGFVHIGEVRNGASSRHFAILFKTLCDATGLYCRLVRDPSNVYYNVVMISELHGFDSVNGSAIGHSKERESDSNGSSDDEEGVDDAPEELVPVFWRSDNHDPKKSELCHPLDSLLQKCNSAADAIDLDDYFVFDRLLGKGSFGEVWKVDLKVKPSKKKIPCGESVLIPGRVTTGPFALKLISSEEADKEEASFMRIYSHPRVINVIAVFRGYQELENRKREVEKKPAMCILMEMADKCLETVLTGSCIGDQESPKTNPCPFKRLDLRFVFRILIDSARAMAFLHSPFGQRPHLVHRDLKPGNVLISADSRAIVTDFGVARMNPSLETNLTVGAGTEGYMAPEQKTLLYDRPADVYSFGVIIARILGVQNWKDASHLSLDDFDESTADPVLVQLCAKCVQVSPLHRPSFDQIHQVLLCEFVKREIARQVINFDNTHKVSNSTRRASPKEKPGKSTKSVSSKSVPKRKTQK